MRPRGGGSPGRRSSRTAATRPAEPPGRLDPQTRVHAECPCPRILLPGKGWSVSIGSGTRCTFKVTGKDTKGRFGLFEYTMAPGTEGARPHIHKKLTEMFYVAEGEMDFVLRRRHVIAPPGTFMLVPERTPHGFSNPGSKRSRLLIMFCPADSRERYFEGLAELTRDGRQPDQKALLRLMAKFDQYMVAEGE